MFIFFTYMKIPPDGSFLSLGKVTFEIFSVLLTPMPSPLFFALFRDGPPTFDFLHNLFLSKYEARLLPLFLGWLCQGYVLAWFLTRVSSRLKGETVVIRPSSYLFEIIEAFRFVTSSPFLYTVVVFKGDSLLSPPPTLFNRLTSPSRLARGQEFYSPCRVE